MNLSLYGEFPVSYYTGVPDISIPLYEIKGKDINVPINLSYHTSGIRPEIHPGPTGLGWTLFAGGAISRTVRGTVRDETRRSYNGVYDGYLLSSELNSANWKELISCDYKGVSDLESDEFSFNFLGFSGKFYFDQNHEIRVQSDRALKIEFNKGGFLRMEDLGLDYTVPNEIDGGPQFNQSIGDFTIIDESGNRYYFGGANAVEVSDPIMYGNTGADMYVTSWFLTKIESVRGADVITFEYERGPFVSQLYKQLYTTTGSSVPMSNYKTQGSFTAPVYLTEINANNGANIKFTYSKSVELTYSEKDYTSMFTEDSEYNFILLSQINQIPRLRDNYSHNKLDNIYWLKLDEIMISDNNNDLQKINFDYNDNTEQRLFLNNLSFYAYPSPVSSEHSYSYSFYYKNQSKMPLYLNCITDHWGFDNGVLFGSRSHFDASLRDPNSNYTQNGILDSIRFPTGGVTFFEYEPNQYSSAVDNKDRTHTHSYSSNKTAGGVRIKRITSSDGIGNQYVKEFCYTKTLNETLSSGILNATPVYFWNYVAWYCGNSFIYNKVQSNSIIPLTQWNDGKHIGYTHVFEKQIDNNSNNGYTSYTFTNHDNGHNDDLVENALWQRESFPIIPHNSRAFERGKLRKKEHYNADGLPVYSAETKWERYGSQGEDNPRCVSFDNMDLGMVFSAVYYLNYVYKFLPSKQEETVYDTDGANPVVTTKTYLYNDFGNEKERTESRSDGSTVIYRARYPKDINVATIPQDPKAIAIAEMYRQNMVSVPIEQTVSVLPEDGAEKFISASINLFTLSKDNIPLLCNQLRILNSGKTDDYRPLIYDNQSRHLKFDDRHQVINEVSYDRYDAKSNLLQYTARDGIQTNFLWGYNNRYPVAKVISNDKYDFELPEPIVHVKRNSHQTLLEPIPSVPKTFTISNLTGGKISHRLEILRGKEAETWQSIIRIKYNGFYKEGYLSEYGDFSLSHNLPDGDYEVEFVTEEGLPINCVKVISEYDIKEFEYRDPLYCLYYEGFEESPSITENKGAAGEKYHAGTYTVSDKTFDNHYIDYKYLQNDKWHYVRKDYVPNETLSNGEGIDEIRIYPKGAQITTYTYQPLVGITSETDPNGITTHYEYDNFGRLKRILDNDRNVLKEYDYYYKN